MAHLRNAPSTFDELEGEIRKEGELDFLIKLEETCKERLKKLLSMQDFELKNFKIFNEAHKMEFEVNCKWKFPNFEVLKKDFERHMKTQYCNFIAMQIEARNYERILKKNWMEIAKNGKFETTFFETPIPDSKFRMERFDYESEMRVLFFKKGTSKSEEALKEEDTTLNVPNPNFPPITTQNPNLENELIVVEEHEIVIEENVQNPNSSFLPVIEHENNANSTNDEMANVISNCTPNISNISQVNPPIPPNQVVAQSANMAFADAVNATQSSSNQNTPPVQDLFTSSSSNQNTPPVQDLFTPSSSNQEAPPVQEFPAGDIINQAHEQKINVVHQSIKAPLYSKAANIEQDVTPVSSWVLVSSSINTNNAVSKQNKKLPLRRSKRIAESSTPNNSEKKHKSQHQLSQSQPSEDNDLFPPGFEGNIHGLMPDRSTDDE